MAFDQPTRNRLARFVGDARALLTEEFTRQLQHEYGLDPLRGEVTDLAKLIQLDDAQRETARILRETLAHYLAGQPAPNAKARQEVLERIVREQAFTVLNRLCALRMAEARGLLLESVAKGYQSRGFQLYARLAGTALGETGDAYRAYLFSLFDEFGVDLAVLFDRFSPQGRLFPRGSTLLQLLDALNQPDIDPLWAEDETIGWIYQYFNSKEERKAMRDASQAPRNSRELAVRNQFFTPRYVVEFLTDNTLGRIWYEMTQGQTSLVDSCRYLVRRPHEIFLAEGEGEPGDKETGDKETRRQGEGELTQEELLRQPVYVPFRPCKDPRTILMLDPACGSMHFGLYAFDLYERIYAEAWRLEEEQGPHALQRPAAMVPLHERYADEARFLRDVPRLIMEHNIHGIDIDPRAVQIAGLSLWLRAQKNWHAQGVKPHERPVIRKSNIVCAEPMPGNKELLEEFAGSLQPPVLGQLVKVIFEKMKLTGEAGTLLKIEEEIAQAVEDARKAVPLLNLMELPDPERFWAEAENRLIDALRTYTELAEGDGLARRLFAADAARGFAFIDVCRKRYDVALMNPPFGKAALGAESYLQEIYPDNWKEVYAGFFERVWSILQPSGCSGCITSSQFLYTKQLLGLRDLMLQAKSLRMFIQLGHGVLDDATVDTGISIMAQNVSNTKNSRTYYLDMKDSENKAELLLQATQRVTFTSFDLTLFSKIESHPFAFHSSPDLLILWQAGLTLQPELGVVATGNHTFDDFRFLRLNVEIPVHEIGKRWERFDKGGEYQPFLSPTNLVLDWMDNGRLLRELNIQRYGTDAQVMQSSKYWRRRGLCFAHVSSVAFGPRVLSEGTIFSSESISIFLNDNNNLLPLLGLLSSTIAQDLIWVFGRYRKIENRAVSNFPISNKHLQRVKEQITPCVIGAIQAVTQLESLDELSPLFALPDALVTRVTEEPRKDIQSQLEQAYELIDSISSTCLSGDPIWAVGEAPRRGMLINQFVSRSASEPYHYERDLISYLVGTCLGRWDIAFTGKPSANESSTDCFSPLPACPPGMFQNAAGLPATPADAPADYQLRISWGGILVEDPGHPEDIVKRVCEALVVIWSETHDAIEQEACQILGVASLRAYFANPNRFFDDHLKRYSKSRRAAPIYWPLSTPSGSYTLWLYYHRLTDQTLYTCVNDFVEPKLAQVNSQVTELRRRTNRSRPEEKELERLSDLALELAAFRDELLRIARFWKPNLNDGVQITAAPLWRLFQHRGWQKRLKETWAALEAGDYDWAHLAYSIWPDRVREKCKTDKSLAIAHDLEALYVEPVKPVKGKKGEKKAKPAVAALGLFEEDTTTDGDRNG